jgi:hypothetical protein
MRIGGMREEVLNVYLALALKERGLVAVPEQHLPDALPDVLVSFNGLMLAIEGKVMDQPRAERVVWRQARQRVDRGIAHLALALLYPSDLRHEPPSELQNALKRAPLCFAICTSFSEQPDWQEGDLEVLVAALQTAYQHLCSDDVVEKAVELLKEGVVELSRRFSITGASVERVGQPLGIRVSDRDRRRNGNREDRRAAIAHIAALVLLNAMLFQEELARNDPRIQNLAKCLDASNPQDEFLRVWEFILSDINYHAVFEIAREILQVLPPDRHLDEGLRLCAEKVREIVRMRVTLRHDLAGRIYHRLLGDIAKPLGTFYTSVAAATLLLHLALNPRWWPLDWGNEDEVAKLRIADFACGTGTLLMAAVQAVVNNFLQAANQKGSAGRHDEDLAQRRQRLLAKLLEDGVWGMDVLASAVHLTATTLALPIPDVMVKGMHLYVLPLGIHGKRECLGSLDLLRGEPLQPTLSLFPSPHPEGRRVTDATDALVSVDPPPMDLICMNPPFTRSTGGNLLFGSLSNDERKRLQKALQQLVRQQKLQASTTAGLGAIFVALAHRTLKHSGRLAFVLPKGLLSGVEWAKTRKLLSGGYHLRALIVSHDPRRWNFSESTDLSEVLVIAERLAEQRPSNIASSDITLCVNLWQNPTNPLNALLLAEKLRELSNVRQDTVHDLWLGNEKVGEVVVLAWRDLKALPHWLFPCAFAQSEIIRILLSLQREGVFNSIRLPLCPLRQLGRLGPQRRDIYDGFEPLKGGGTPTDYPAFWGHDASGVTTLFQSPNAYLLPLRKPRPGRPLRSAEVLWSGSSKVLLAERMWLKTQRLTAVLLSERVLSNVWWPLRLRPGLDERHAKALTLWLNSTLGLILLIANRTETRGSWVQFKKEPLHRMLVLDVRALTPGQLEKLASTFDDLKDKPLQSLSQMADDKTRAVIDQAISEALSLSDLTGLRRKLAQEPLISLKPLRLQRIR